MNRMCSLCVDSSEWIFFMKELYIVANAHFHFAVNNDNELIEPVQMLRVAEVAILLHNEALVGYAVFFLINRHNKHFPLEK